MNLYNYFTGRHFIWKCTVPELIITNKMGGCGGRGTLVQEEKAITKGEDQLGWQKANTKDLIQYFKKYSHDQKLRAIDRP